MTAKTPAEVVRERAAAGCPLAREIRVMRGMCSCFGDEAHVDEAQARYAEMVAALSAPQGEVVMRPYVLGRAYKTQGGESVTFVSIVNAGTDYECMADAAGVHRYTRRIGDMGRVTGSPHDYSDPRNVPPIYTTPPAPQAVGEALREVKLRLHFLGMPGEPMWNAGSEDAPRWVPDWRFEIDLIEHALHGSPRKFATRPTDTRRRIETEAHPTPSPAPQGGGEAAKVLRECIEAVQREETDAGKMIGYRAGDELIRRFRAALATPPAQQPGANDSELPGMWSSTDFTGGDPDERSYADRAQQPGEVVTDEMVEAAARRMSFGAWDMLETHVQGRYIDMARAALAPKEKGNG